MELSLPLRDGLRLVLDDGSGADAYPTGRLCGGLLLADGERLLAGEGVGFGVPVVKRGAETVFPGTRETSLRRNGAAWEVQAVFGLDLVERLATRRGTRLSSRPAYAAKDALAALHRRAPALRAPLTAVSSALRATFDWVTTYEPTDPVGTVAVAWSCAGEGEPMRVAVDLGGLHREELSEIAVMNEQGAQAFDRYRDGAGTVLEGSSIEAWRQVGAAEASFSGSGHDVYFSVRQADGAKLHRGRELVGTRLAWAGFGYVMPAAAAGLVYEVTIGRRP